MLNHSTIVLTRMDLEEREILQEPVDLAISLEVAEHLSEARAESFIDDLCAASAQVLFGAEIPHQGGACKRTVAKLLGRKILGPWIHAYDVVRPEDLGNANVPYWYQQNSILYIRAGQERFGSDGAKRLPRQLDMVHPDLFRHILKKTLSSKIRGWLRPFARLTSPE